MSKLKKLIDILFNFSTDARYYARSTDSTPQKKSFKLRVIK